MLIAFRLFVACVVIMVAATLILPEPLKPEARPLIWESWREPLRGPLTSYATDYRVMAAAIVLTFIVLYGFFR
jgi:hypothetical protein